ncbi:hypothetical protein [Natronosalvus rutilus]|nr:hypothetical protein [Natronosalvus rutilus]
MIRLIDRGHILSGLVHFVFMSWLGAIVAAITTYVVNVVVAV